MAALALQLDLFFDVLELFVDGFDFEAPLKRVELRLQYLVLLGLLKELLLLLLERRVEEADLGLLDPRLGYLSPQVRVARPAALQYWLRAADQVPSVLLRLDLNAVNLLRALQARIVLEVVGAAGLVDLLGEDGLVELVLSPVQLNVEQLVNDVADLFSVARLQRLGLHVARGLAPELLQVVQQFCQCFHCVPMIVFEVDKYSQFLCLSAKCKHSGQRVMMQKGPRQKY